MGQEGRLSRRDHEHRTNSDERVSGCGPLLFHWTSSRSFSFGLESLVSSCLYECEKACEDFFRRSLQCNMFTPWKPAVTRRPVALRIKWAARRISSSMLAMEPMLLGSDARKA